MPVDHLVELPGVGLRLRSWPGPRELPPVVLLPATGETAEDWDAVAAVLSESRTAFAVDLRGHGESDWSPPYSIESMSADVVALLDQLAPSGPMDLVGHSLGGLVACRAAAARPSSVRRLVLEDVGVLRPRRAAPPDRPPGELEFDWRVVEQVRPQIDQPSADWPVVLRAVEAPTLIVSGGSASPVTADQVAELVHRVRDCSSATIEAGHLVHASEPGAFLEVLLRFLDG